MNLLCNRRWEIGVEEIERDKDIGRHEVRKTGRENGMDDG